MSDDQSPAGTADPIETLQHAMVEGLMGVIGAPDDADVAAAGDEIVRKLDAALRATADAA
ncbi:hypothetical protein ACFZB9_21715 [Kitasatospora sp. NPDC008050]|uniref:hypothetical protein n=1 Tax=Kitasatospora sp. NPDC008050 TaxID=3364021 RepID=UPI0036E7F7A8